MKGRIGKPTPELFISLRGGEQVLLSQHRGKVIALEILLTTCPHCQRASGVLQKMYEEFAGRGFLALGAAINEEAKPGLLNYVMSLGLKYPVGITPREAAYAYLDTVNQAGPIYMPQMVFIDRKGVIRAYYPGTDDFFKPENEEKNMREQILKLLNEGSGHAAKKGSVKK
jgi:peroxiredoxin